MIRILLSTRLGISIHALREEDDGSIFHVLAVVAVFLSTPSARRATIPPPYAMGEAKHFYPRPPRGGRPGLTGRPAAFI